MNLPPPPLVYRKSVFHSLIHSSPTFKILILVCPPSFLGFRLIERLHHGGSSLREVVAALEADMEAMYDMIDRFGGGSGSGGSGGNNAAVGDNSGASGSASTGGARNNQVI